MTPPVSAPDVAARIDMGDHASRLHPCLGLQGCGLEFYRQIQPRQLGMLAENCASSSTMHHDMTGVSWRLANRRTQS